MRTRNVTLAVSVSFDLRKAIVDRKLCGCWPTADKEDSWGLVGEKGLQSLGTRLVKVNRQLFPRM